MKLKSPVVFRFKSLEGSHTHRRKAPQQKGNLMDIHTKHGGAAAPSSPPPNDDQLVAIAVAKAWLATTPASLSDRFFLLEGEPGTGKTFCVGHLLEDFKGRIIFTAPYNKAVKVLRKSLTTDRYKPECRTLYSLLGLRLEANGGVRELAVPDDPLDLSQYRLIVIDEGSTVNSQVWDYVLATVEKYELRVLVMGDRAQLPPVGETESRVFGIENKALLTKVERHGGDILQLARAVRAKIWHPAPSIKLESANSDGQGVWKLSGNAFVNAMTDERWQEEFLAGECKVIAWRNVTTSKYNQLIRQAIFKGYEGGEGNTWRALPTWLPLDRVIFAAPAKDLEGEPLATTDDEGTVTSVDTSYHPAYPSFKNWILGVTLDDNTHVVARILHEDSLPAFTRKCEELATAARIAPHRWEDFWSLKEAFHDVRYAYAITAHRAQGSTYKTAFVDAGDILVNRNRREAFQCLCVAVSRPQSVLIVG